MCAWSSNAGCEGFQALVARLDSQREICDGLQGVHARSDGCADGDGVGASDPASGM